MSNARERAELVVIAVAILISLIDLVAITRSLTL